MSQEAIQKLKGPAIGLKIVAVLNVVTLIANVAYVMVLGGLEAAQSGGEEEALAMLFSGGMMVVLGILGIAASVFIWIGATKMAQASSYGMAMGAAIVAMLPCLSSCCIVGIPIGIWAIVVLVNAEVKEAFQPQL